MNSSTTCEHGRPAILHLMGQRSKALVAEKYTWSQVTQKTLVLYDWLLGRGERPDFVMMD